MSAIKKKPCLICGKPFKPCSTITAGLNWRRLFCSEECCKEWMRRQNTPLPENKDARPEEPVVAETVAEEPVVPVEEPVAEEVQEVVKPTRKVRRRATKENE